VIFQGHGVPDVRFFFPKDKAQGYTGVVPSHMALPFIQSSDVVPAAATTSNIAAAATVTTGVAMTLAGASAGVTLNVPVMPFPGYGALNGGTVATAAIALDLGFAFGNVTSGSTTVVVADSTQFISGMPLVIGGVGNSGGTACLLTNVASITDATHIVITGTPAATLTTAPIAAGNLWGPSENGYVTPTAAMPYLARGPGLFLDPQQALSRGVQIVGTNAANTGGTFLVTGWDVYGMPMSQLVTVAAGASTGYSTKTFKYIGAVTPQFTDATAGHTYSVGTSDVFGFAVRSDRWEYTNVCWNGAFVTSSTGYLASDKTIPATTTTGDVRGTVQVSATGGGAGITGGSVSNGAITSLVMTGKRLVAFQSQPLYNVVLGTVTNTRTMYGSTQV
jgi:hypothetical protein